MPVRAPNDDGAEQSHRLQLALMWNRRSPLTVRSVKVTAAGRRCAERLPQVVRSNAGELYVDLGMFPVGAVGIQLHLEAETRLQKLNVFVIQDERRVEQFAGRRASLRTFPTSERWSASWIYTVGGAGVTTVDAVTRGAAALSAGDAPTSSASEGRARSRRRDGRR